MPTFERDCPICFRTYSWDRMRVSPPRGGCSHGFCEPCGEQMAYAMKTPPFRCPMCREDITTWFVDYFDWVSAEERRNDRIAKIEEARSLLVRNGPLDPWTWMAWRRWRSDVGG